MFLEVRTDNEAARALYEAEGFTVVGLRKRYYRPSGADAYTMRREADDMIVLGIETSCDETGVGIVRARSRTARVDAAGQRGRLQRGRARPLRRRGARGRLAGAPAGDGARRAPRARHRRASTGRDVDAVAVTAGPGLAGALLVGVAAAKAYAAAWDVPLYGVNHLAAHVAVDTLQHGPLPPCLALLVSGGHSSLLDVPDLAGPVTPLGATIDDAAGEAFDKVARLLGLPFPGGPHIDRVARDGDPARDPRSRAASPGRATRRSTSPSPA